MRSSSVWLVLGAVCACVASSLFLRPASAEDATPKAPAVSEETVRTVDTMRRVLVREGLYTRADQGKTVQAVNFSSQVSEAFVLPGQGAIFVLRTADSVVAPREEPVATPPDKVWDEEAAVLDGKIADKQRRRAGQPFDAAKVEALRTRLLDALATYGHRVRGLGPNERLTVVVVGGGAAADPVLERTVLTIQVSVADCQAVAAKQLTLEKFRRQAILTTY